MALQAPWDFTSDLVPGEPTVPNAPTPEGAALGRELARICDVEEAKLREHLPDVLPRCDDCAARLGTVPNQCPGTLMDLVKCAMESEPFYCHKGTSGGDREPKRLCTGYVCLVHVNEESHLPEGAR